MVSPWKKPIFNKMITNFTNKFMFMRFHERKRVFLFWSLISIGLFCFLSASPAIAADESKGGLKSPGQIIPNPRNGNKVTSLGGYSRLFSKAQTHGRIRIIVRVAVPYSPESLLSEQERPKQRAEISNKQDKLLADIRGSGRIVVDPHAFKYTPHLSMTVDAETINALLDSPDIESIHEDIPVPPTLNLSVPRIGGTQLHSSGVNGAGVTLAILDTGVDKNHPFLNNSVVSEACYSSNYSW